MTAVTWLAGTDAWYSPGRTPISYGTPPPDHEPPDPTPEAPASWQAAVNALDVSQVVLWYEAHTGHDGINPDDPNDTPLAIGDLTGDGSGIDSQYDGQVIEGVIASRIRIRHNNVTVRRSRVTNPSLYGLQFYPTFGETFTGAVVEFVTFDGQAISGDNAPVMVRPGETAETALTLRHCEIVNFSTGGRLENRCIAEYNYQHDAYHPEGGHASGFRFMGAHGIARRNLSTDSRSSNFGMYLDQGFMHSVTYEENILGGTINMPDGRVISPSASPSYGMILGMGSAPLEPYDLRIINNWWYGGYQFGLTSGNIPWGIDGNERRGNRALQTFTVQPGTGNEVTYQAGQLLPFNDA